MLNLTTAVRSAQYQANRAAGAYPSVIQMCRIDKVDTKRKLVKVYIFDSKMYREDVPYMFSYTDGTNGILFSPRVGSFGVLVKDSAGLPLIIGFTMPVILSDTGPTRDMPHRGEHNMEELAEGEFVLSSCGGARVKVDAEGGTRISSSTMDHIHILPGGHIDIEAARDITISVGEQQISITRGKIVLKGNVEIQGSFEVKESVVDGS